MKNIIFAALSLFTLASHSQNTIPANPTTTPPAVVPAAAVPGMNNYTAPDPAALTVSMDSQGFVSVLIPQTQQRDVQKDWVKYAAYQSKGKAIIVNGDNIQYGAINKNISPSQFNISCRLLGSNDGVRTTVWLTDVNSPQASTQLIGDRNTALQKYVRDFAVQEYRQAVLDEMKTEQQKQAAMESDLAKLVKAEERAEKMSEKNRFSIKESDDAMLVNNKDIQNTSAQIESQKGMVENTAADANATKGAKKTLSEMEDKKRDLEKRNETLGKNMEMWNNEIRANDKIVADDREKEASKKAAIENEKQTILQVKSNLEAIK